MLGEGVGDDAEADDARLVELDDDLAVRLGCFRELPVADAAELLELSIKLRRGRLEADRSDSSLALPPSESENRSEELVWLWDEDPEAALRLDLDPETKNELRAFETEGEREKERAQNREEVTLRCKRETLIQNTQTTSF